MHIRTILFAAFLSVTLPPLAAHAGAAPEEAIAVLQKRGYTGIEIAPGESPGYDARACKGGTRFSIRMDANSNIIDVDPMGNCSGGSERYADAPPVPPGPGHRDGLTGESYSGPAIAHAPLFDELYRRGYYDIRVTDSDDDEVEVLACRAGRLYEIEIKRNGRIDDIDRKGACRLPRRGDGAHVEAPFASVHTGRGNVDVEAPFTGVHVGKGGVRIRAPFVDLKLP